MMPITCTLKKDQWLGFEAEMITQTQLDHILAFNWEDLIQTEEIRVNYEIPPHTYTVNQLLENKQFTTRLLNDLCSTLISLNKTLQSYMLSNHNICHHPEHIYYSTQLNKFYFYYTLDAAYQHEYSVLDLVRHLSIEINAHHLFSFLKMQTFELEFFQSKLIEQKPKLWQKLSKSTKHHKDVHYNCTPQKNVYPMLLDRYNPTESHKLYFEHNTIGRDEQSNVYIEDLSISRNHGALYKLGHTFLYKDLLSTNGSKVNGVNCHSEHVIVNGDIIQIGEKEFVFIR